MFRRVQVEVSLRVRKSIVTAVKSSMCMIRIGRVLIVIACLSVFTAGGRCFAQGGVPTPETQSIRVTDETEVDSAGNSKSRVEISCSPLFYNVLLHAIAQRGIGEADGKPVLVKERAPADAVIRYLGIGTSSGLVSDVQSEYDDPATTIITSFKERGHLTHRDGRWLMNVGSGLSQGQEVRRADVRGTTVHMDYLINQPGIQLRLVRQIRFPDGTTELTVDRDTLTASAVMPAVEIPPEKAKKKPSVLFNAKPELMTALYKLYGQPNLTEFWAARSVVENTMGVPLEDVRVRFKLDNMADWSPWETADAVVPGQTWIIPYFPVLDASVMSIQNVSTTYCHMELVYSTAGGDEKTVTNSTRMKVLGAREARYNSYEVSATASFMETFRNAGPIFASFVTPNDPVIMDVLGMVARSSAGRAYGQDDESTLRFLSTLYQFLRTNISYEQTAGRVDKGFQYQTLKFARDVVRTRSGTCINLAILYASVCEAANLDVSLVLVPGHCFVKVMLPSGQMVCVETTGCDGGTLESSNSFVWAQATANVNYLKRAGTPEILEYRMRALRAAGIWPPELPDVGTAPLTTWGINVPPPAAPESFVAANLLTGTVFACQAAGIEVAIDPKNESGLAIALVHTQQQKNWIVKFSVMEASAANGFVPNCVVWSHIPLTVDAAQRDAFSANFKPFVRGVSGEVWYDNEGTPHWLTQPAIATRVIQSSDILESVRATANILPEAIDSYLGSRNAAPGQEWNKGVGLNTQTRTKDAQIAAKTQIGAPIQVESVGRPVDAPPSLAGLWTTFYNDDDGNLSSTTFRFEVSGAMAFNAGNNRKGYTESRGQYSYENNRLTYELNGESFETSIVWVNCDEFRMQDDDGYKLAFRRLSE